MSADDETELALRTAIEAASLDDDATRQVYADWLLERGDVRGELLLVQLARHRDPLWARPRLRRVEQRLIGRVDTTAIRVPLITSQPSWLFDRGAQGLALDLRHVDILARQAPRWLRPTWPSHPQDDAFAVSARDSALEALRDHPQFATVHRLDLSSWSLGRWEPLLASAARPRHVILPGDAGERIDVLLDAPLFANVEHLDLRGSCNDAAIARLVAAPWAANLTTVVCGRRSGRFARWYASLDRLSRDELGPITDEGLACLARLPRIAHIDARMNAITARGIELLAHANPRALVALRLSLDTLGTDGLAAVEQSRFAGSTRVSVAGPWLTSPDPVVALTSSPCWDGTLDLDSIPRYEATVDVEAIITALAAASPLRPLVGIRLGLLSDGFFETFVHAPIARTITHLDATRPGELADAALRLQTARFASIDPYGIRPLLAAPALAGVQGLSLQGVTPKTVGLVAASPIRPRDLELVGGSTTAATCALVKSPVVEHVTDLTLAVDGNHAAKTLTTALLDTPYLKDVQRLELDFVVKFPLAPRMRLVERYPNLDRAGWPPASD